MSCGFLWLKPLMTKQSPYHPSVSLHRGSFGLLTLSGPTHHAPRRRHQETEKCCSIFFQLEYRSFRVLLYLFFARSDVSHVFQNPPNTSVRRCLDPLKAFSGEGPNTYSQGIWKDWGIEDMFGLFLGNGAFHQNLVLFCCSPFVVQVIA